jgi:arginyl-tRNA synthetase
MELQAGRPGYRALWQHFVNVSVADLEESFDALGVHFDHWYGESTVHDRIEPMLKRIEASGVARRSDGALVIDVARPDDTMDVPPLILVKSDGSYLYGTTDLATIEMRVQDQHADDILYVVDARQSLHFVQVFRAARLTGIAPDDVALEHVGFGTVNGPDGKPFKTRAGGLIRLRDLIDMVIAAAERRLEEAEIAQEYPVDERRRIARAVGVAALKFGDLSNHRMSNYIFDLDRFVSFEGKTGPYLQYSAVRIRSILRNADERDLRPTTIVPATIDAERDLMLALTRLPEVLDRTLELRAPNHLAEYAYDIATVFNRFYDRCHILREPNRQRQGSWLALVATTLDMLSLLLDLLGIEVPERM